MDDVVISDTLGYSRNDGREFDSVIQKTTLWKVSVYDFYYNSCYISVCYVGESHLGDLFHRDNDSACDGSFESVCHY
jgi:hypothetical protein